VLDQQPLAGEFVAATVLAHLFRVDDLAGVVKRGTDKHLLAIKRETEITVHAIAEQRRRFEDQLVMAYKPRGCPEVRKESKRAIGCHRFPRCPYHVASPMEGGMSPAATINVGRCCALTGVVSKPASPLRGDRSRQDTRSDDPLDASLSICASASRRM